MSAEPLTARYLLGYSKGSTIASSRTHVWGRCAQDPRHWVVIPVRLTEPVYRAVPDDFGRLAPVGQV